MSVLCATNLTAARESRARLHLDGVISEWSFELQQLTGWPAERVIGRPISELVTALEPHAWPNLRDATCLEPFRGLIALPGVAGAPPRPYRARVSSLSGRGWSLELDVLPNLRVDADGGSAAQPTARGVEQQRLEFMLSHMPGFCYTVDANFTFTSSVGAGLSRLNLREGQVVGTTLMDLWGTNDPSYEPLACHLRALSGSTETYQDVCLGRSLEYRLTALFDASGQVIGVLGVAFDVTEREQANGERVKLTAQLRQAQKLEAIGRLAGGVAHDFNNLLTCIMGNLTLAESLSAPDSRIARHLAGANSAAESAATLTRQLLAFGRKQVIAPRALSLTALIERVRGMLQRLIGEDITLRTSCAPDLWAVHADSGQLEQVLVNLIVNARDAITGNGEIVIETRNLELALPHPDPSGPLRPGKYVLLSVRDSGRGMSEGVRAKLFEPFFTTKETGAGTGLGLATVYGAVEQNGGAITVESELGAGSTFRIFLPMVEARPEAASSVRRQPSADANGRYAGHETILLVEDEPMLLELAQCALQQLGYNVLACGGADEALRRFTESRSRIDLLVTDVVMPRMNGKELASRISALAPGISVLFSSGYGEDIIAKQGVLDAGLHFIAKPYRPAELSAKVRSVLDLREKTPLPASQPLR
jgi:signal transduction histidine kinase/ActR/RegA family two-component response regulator